MQQTNVGIVGGGGKNAFFGLVHRRAIGLREHEGIRLVAGVLRSTPEASLTAAVEWGIRGYGTVQQMLETERDLDYVVIAAPNHAHFLPAQLCLRAGKPVLCEKPLTLNLAEALELERLAAKNSVPFGVAYTYCGSWPFLLARGLVLSGRLGAVRYAEATYDQGWQARNLGIQQEWRQDPERAGAFCCGGDIGSHGFQAVRWMTGLEIAQVCVDATKHVEGRRLDDTFRAFVRLSNNADGLVTATQIKIGHKNDHRVSVVCEDGTVEVGVEEPETVTLHLHKQPSRVFCRGENCSEDLHFGHTVDSVAWAKELPSGHVEGFLSHLANIHLAFARHIAARKRGAPQEHPYPTLADGVAGMKILHACAENAPSTTKWTLVPI